MSAIPAKVILRLPSPHSGGQEIFFNWSDIHYKAQCLVAPCGTKVGKTFGATLWMLKEALVNRNLYCAWIAPTYLKCRIAYRYFKAMLPNTEWFNAIDGRLEIQFANGSFVKFMHGRDAEVTVEGEAVDRFVIDEAGKINRQVWVSLLTTITQTRGFGIVTGTPRGYTWYYELAKMAQSGNDFFAFVSLRTEDSPFINPEAIAQAKKLLPPHLYDQYYNARFISSGTTFGDLYNIWDESLTVLPKHKRFWIHPDKSERSGDVIHGVDIAKKFDYTVFYSVNMKGKLVGFCRFKHIPYPHQVIRLRTYLINYFFGENIVRYDATGVGEAFGDALEEADINASINGVCFSNKSKSEMVTKTILAIQTSWHSAPRIGPIESEFSSYELTVTPSGLHKYSAPEGEHDDVVSAAILAISEAYMSSMSEDAEKLLESTLSGKNNDEDWVSAYSHLINDSNPNEFFDDESEQEDFFLDYENE